jgi:predicted nucleotidyltransferase
MPSADVQRMIPVLQAYFATQPVKRAYLFGSCSRGEETPNSDVDLLVTLDHSQPIGLKFFSMIADLESRLGRSVDMVSEDGVQPFARPYIDQDKILLYERAH